MSYSGPPHLLPPLRCPTPLLRFYPPAHCAPFKFYVPHDCPKTTLLAQISSLVQAGKRWMTWKARGVPSLEDRAFNGKLSTISRSGKTVPTRFFSRKRGSSVPRDSFRLSMLSSWSSAQTSAFFTTVGQMQTVPHFSSLREARQRLRESSVTVRSGTASSVYPPSSSTVSGTESPSLPRSIADAFQDHHISSVDPDEPYDDYQAFHTDDVSSRLRLLLNNNYFLPPAHSKPSPSDFASPVAAPYKKATRSAAPTFLDIFRVGKARSKPTTPPSPLTPDVGPLRLRTTADLTITSSRAPSSRVDPVPHRPIVPISAAHASRVAVVPDSCPLALSALKTTTGSLTAMSSENAISKDTYPISAMVNQRIQVQLHDHLQLWDDQRSRVVCQQVE
jgi:hypothetical protein